MDPFTIFVAVVSIISGVASYQQAKKMQREADRESRGVEANIESNIKAIPVIYGERRVGGTRVYIDTSKDIGNKYLYMVMAMAEGEVEDIHSIEIDDIPITDEKFILSGLGANFTYEIFYGSDTQVASDLIIDGVAYSNAAEVPPEVAIYLAGQESDKPWNQNHKLNGVAYLAMRFLWDTNAYNGVPNVTAIVKGKKVYDPRNPTAPKAWSNNPALCIRDYLTSSRYGKGIPESAINDTMFSQAANDYDSFVVTPYDGGDDITLFELNTVIDTEVQIINNLNDMLMSCRGFLPYVDGKYGIRVDQATNHVMDVSSDHIIGGISIVGTKKEDRFNQVKVNFFNKDKEYKEDTAVFPDVDDPSDVNNLYQQYLAEDGGEPLVDDIKIDGISNYYTAREMAKLFLLRSRLGTAIAFRGTSELMELEVGDTFLITQPTPAWTNKKFQVQEIGLNFDGTVNIQAIEYSDSIYTYNEASEETPFVPTKLPDPNKLAPVTALSASAGTDISADGKTISFIDLSWTAPNDALVDRYEIKYTIDDVTSVVYSAVAIDPTHRIVDAEGSYDISVYAVNGFGAKSTGVTLSNVVSVTDTTAPSNITSINISAGLQSISLSWTNPSEYDFDLVRIKVANTNAQPTAHSFEVRSDSFVHDIGAYSTTKYYWLAPVDRTGNVGSYVSGGSATTGSIAIGDVPAVVGTFYLTLGDNNAPTNAEFNSAIGRDPIEGDVVVVNKAYFFTRGASSWSAVTEFIDGSLLVSDSVTATSLSTISADLGAITAGSIDINNGALTIDEDGNLIGTSVTLTGDITANTLTLTGAQVEDSRSSPSLILSASQLDQSVINLIDTRIESYGLGSSGYFAEDTGGFNNTIPDHPVLENFTHLNGKNVEIELTASSTWSGTGSPTYPPLYPNNDSSLVIEIQRRVSTETDWTNAVVVDTITNGTSPSTVITGGTWSYGYSSVWFNGLTINYTFNDDPATGTYDYRAFIKTIGTNYIGVSTFYFEANEAGTASGGGVNDYVDSFSINDSTGLITVGRTGTLGDLTASISTYVGNQVSALVDSAPATLDTLNELAAALGDDANFSTTMTTALGTKWTQDNTKISNWDTAYGWGNHASVGYITSYTESDTLANVTGRGSTTNSSLTLNGKVSFGSNGTYHYSPSGAKANNDARDSGDGARLHRWNRNHQDTAYLAYYENWYDGNSYHSIGIDSERWKLSDGLDVSGTVTATDGNSTNWNTAYGWGDHASAGYLTSLPSHTHTIANVTGLQTALDDKVDDSQVLTNVPSGAVFTDTVYSHPSSHPATMITTTDEFTYSNSTNVQDVLDDLDQAIANVNAKDPVITLTGDVTGTGTMTNLGNVSITTAVANDSHSHSNYITSNADDSYSGSITATGTDWYLWSLGARGASSGAYGIGNRNADSSRQLTFHVPNRAAYSDTGVVPSFGWYSNGAVELMRLASDTGDLTVKNSYQINGTTVVDSSRNLTNINTVTASGLIKGNQLSSLYWVTKQLSGTQMGNSYNERVILLCPKVETTTFWNNIVDGKITMLKSGGNVCDSFDVFCHSVYNDTRATFTSRGQRTGHKLVTCTYGGIKWVAIKFEFTANPYNYALFQGQAYTNVTDHDDNQLKIISYYDTLNGGTILDSEVYNSIADYNSDDTYTVFENGSTTFNSPVYGKSDIRSFYSSTNYAQLESNVSGGVLKLEGNGSTILRSYGISEFPNGLGIGTTTVIDSSRNLTNIGTISAAGSISVTGYNTVSAYSGAFTYLTGALTGSVVGNVTGNASTATKWATARTITLGGDLTGSISIDGSANVTLSGQVVNDSHTHDGRYYTETESDSRYVNVTGDTMTGDLSFGSQVGTWISSTAMNDAIGWNSSYGTYIGSNVGGTHYLRGNGTFSTTGGTYKLFHDAYHPNADKWTSPRVLTLTGDVSGTVTWDGSANASMGVAVLDDSHSHANYITSNADDTTSGSISTAINKYFGYASTYRYTPYTTGGIGTRSELISAANFLIHADTDGSGVAEFVSIRAGAGTANELKLLSKTSAAGVNNQALTLNGNKVFNDAYHPNADKWTTARTITLSGDLSGSVSIDGSANVTLSAQVSNNSHSHNYIFSDVQSSAPSNALQYLNTQGNSNDSPTNDWYNTIRMGHGDPNTYYNNTLAVRMTGSDVGSLWGRTTSNGTKGTWRRFFADDYHPNADKWTTARTLSLTGDVTGSVSWDGSANASITTVVANDSHTHTVDNISGLVEGTSFSGEYASLFHIGGNRIFSDASMRFRGSDSRLTVDGIVNTPTYQVNGTTVIDSARNGFFANTTHTGSMYWNGHIYWGASKNIYVQSGECSFDVSTSAQWRVWDATNSIDAIKVTGGSQVEIGEAGTRGLKVFGATNSTTGYQVNGTTVIDSGRNITVGAITASGKLYFNKDGQTNYHSVIDIDHVENNLWSFVFQSSTVGNDNESGFWVGNNGYPDLRIRRDDATVRALISSWETSYVSNNFNVAGGDLQVGGTTVIDSARNATVNKVTATASGMSEFSTDLSSNDDYINSPISIRERNMAGSAASADMYAPNLNFHWSGRWSNSLWMNSSGHLVYGGYDTVGTPAANGVFVAGAVRTNTLTDLADTSTFLELEGDSLGMRLQTVNGFFRFGARNSTWCHMETDRSGFYFYKKINVVGTTNSTTGYEVNGTTVFDSSRNLTNIGTISSGNITGADANFNHIGVRNTSSSTGDGISLYNGATGGQPEYGLMFAGTATFGQHGSVTGDWATYFTMSNTNNRGWIFKRGTTNVASINGAGDASFTGSVSSSNAITATGNITANNGWVKSGAGGFYVSGNQIVNSSRDLLNIGNITCSGTNNTLGDINIQENVSAAGYTFMRFKAYSTGNTLGSIYRSYGSMVYSTSSDYRLKENIVDLTGASDKIMAIPVRRFNFIEHPDRIVDGFLAHEVAKVVPEAVLGEKDAIDANGKPEYQSIDQSKLVPLLTAGLQEALAEIENLKARLSALEN